MSGLGAVVDAVTDGPVHVVTFSRGTSSAVAWALAHPGGVRSLAIGDYVPEEKVLPDDVSDRLLGGRWLGTPVSERLDVEAGVKMFRAARDQSFWEPLAQLGLPLLAVRSDERVLVGEEEWTRYQRQFPDARLVEFHDSPHDIFRPDRGRYPQRVSQHVAQSEMPGLGRALSP